MTTVKLNVYELIMSQAKAAQLGNDALAFIGMGVYHTGLEVYGQEISFGMDPTGRNDPSTDGVFIVTPGGAVGNFKDSIELGPIKQDYQQVQQILDSIRPQWRAASYHMLGHNCNCFTKAFAEALDPALLEKYPGWVNRSATAGNIVLPNALLKSLTEAIAPPSACAPDLINNIFLPYQGSAPRALPPASKSKAAPASGGGGLFGAVKGVASKVTSGVKSLTDSSTQKAFEEDWQIPGTELIDKFRCRVIHINRTQDCNLYVARKALCFSGPNQLHLQVPLTQVVSLQYAIKKKDEQPNVPPSFDPTSDDTKADALLIFLQGGNLVPVYNVGSMIGKAGALIGNSHTKQLLECIDSVWRENVNVS